MSHSADALPILDDSVFQELLESLGAPAAVAAIYNKFLGNAATFIRDLATQDAAARIETLHTLKGSAAMLGAKRMAALAAQIQTYLHGPSVQIEHAARELERELAKLRVAASERVQAAGGTLAP